MEAVWTWTSGWLKMSSLPELVLTTQLPYNLQSILKQDSGGS